MIRWGAVSEPPVSPGEIVAGKYLVERVLGAGGMGVVVAAWHQELEQRVAIKFLLPDVAQRADAAERFRREARAAAKIRSEHVVRVLDVGTLEGRAAPYMVMEYLDGQDLSSRLEQGALPIDRAVDWLIQAMEAVAEAHSVGIVHRDLKPANLFISSRTDGSVCVKVLDFGISKNMNPASQAGSEMSLTKTSGLVGSPLYMSPEQMRASKDIDGRADVWALASILFEAVSGRTPYTGDTVPELVASMMIDPPPRMATLRPGVPADFEAVLVRGLARDREERWQSVDEFATALAPFGTEAARLHVDRIARVASGSMLPRKSSAASTQPNPNSRTPISVDRPEAHAATMAGPTLAGVGRTDDTGKRSTPRRVWMIAAGVAALLAVGLVIALRPGAKPSAEPVTTEPPSAPTAARGEPVTAPQKTETLQVAPATAAATPEAAPSATASASPSRRKSPAQVGPRPPDDGLTDFGGRR